MRARGGKHSRPPLCFNGRMFSDLPTPTPPCKYNPSWSSSDIFCAASLFSAAIATASSACIAACCAGSSSISPAAMRWPYAAATMPPPAQLLVFLAIFCFFSCETVGVAVYPLHALRSTAPVAGPDPAVKLRTHAVGSALKKADILPYSQSLRDQTCLISKNFKPWKVLKKN